MALHNNACQCFKLLLQSYEFTLTAVGGHTLKSAAGLTGLKGNKRSRWFVQLASRFFSPAPQQTNLKRAFHLMNMQTTAKGEGCENN